ncbi:hypothetical protein [Nostoc sp. PA-18-2419]|uniref:hypothetical protein n=1 Tax=Nostoc sp. PA-18-2419 TaxID=2575443 RepID=UPI001CB8BB1F|nr:hypothetical protein [Nostoc sp. PA-18-2419]
MMKSFCVPLFVAISALALPQSAFGNQENIPNPTGDRNQAQVLLTEPATINTKWTNFAGRTNNLKPIPHQTISAIQDQQCPKINPREIINNPESFFKACPKQSNAQTRQSYEPIDYLKVPKLDSGIKLTVTQF